MTRIHLATGIALRGDPGDPLVLLVASTYPNQRDPLWNLPGGRQRENELLCETVEREVFEETGARARANALAYVSESYDGSTHVLNAAFAITLLDEPAAKGWQPRSTDHVSAVAWTPVRALATTIAVAVVRDPLIAYLRGDLARQYAGFHRAGISITWPEGSE